MGEEAGRTEEFEKALKAEQERAESYLNQMKYLQADLENFRRRLAHELEEAGRRSILSLLPEVLDIKDDLDRAISMVEKETPPERMLEGLSMLASKLDGLLRTRGVEPIPTVGHRFDPERHEVVSTVESQEKEEGTIVAEVRRGYLWNGRVLRTAMVEVVKKPAPPPEPTPEGERDSTPENPS